MVFRRMSPRLHPVRSIKHIVDTNGLIVGSGQSVNDIVNVKDDPSNTVTNECAVGSTVGAIFLNVQVVQQVVAGGIDNIYMIVYKNPGNNVVNPAPDSVGTSDKRRFVIHQEMVMIGSSNSVNSPVPKALFKGVIVIPRALKRNAIQDKWQVVIAHRLGEATQTTQFCLQCIYKEFR